MSVIFPKPLSDYAVLAGVQIKNSGNTLIINGNLGSPEGNSPGGITYIDGAEDDSSNATMAQVQINDTIMPLLLECANITSLPSPTICDGNYVFYPGGYKTDVNITLNAGKTITFDALGKLNAQFYINASRIVFTGGSVILINGSQYDNIFWISNSDITTHAVGINIAGNFIANTSITIARDTSVNGRLFAQTGAISLTSNIIDATSPTLIPDSMPIPTPVLPSTPSHTSIPPTPPISPSVPQHEHKQPSTKNKKPNSNQTPCYLKGTRILTNKGYVCVENLKVGDHLITRGDIWGNNCVNRVERRKPIIWIGRFVIDHSDEFTRPICITKNVFGNHLPENDLYISPNHNLILHDKLVIAHTLVDDKRIYQVHNNHKKTEYYHIELDRHSAIIAEGILSESYIDISNRYFFEHSSHIKVSTKKK